MSFGKPSYTPLSRGEKIRVIFLFQIPSFWPSWESVYRAGTEDERFEVKLLWLDELAFSKAQMIGAEEFLTENQLAYAKFNEFNLTDYKPHIVVLQSPYDTTHRPVQALSLNFTALGARVVYIPYGIEISDTPLSRINHFYTFTVLNAWRIYVMSSEMAGHYKEHCPNRAAVRVCGHPKFDSYADKGRFEFPDELRRLIGNRRTVLWKMHFPKMEAGNTLITPNIDEYVKFADKVSDFPDLFFIFTPHPLMLAESDELETAAREKSQILLAMLATKENVYVYGASDYRAALSCAEAVIIDRSALMIEAALTGAPILYMYNADNIEKMTDAIAPLLESFYQGTTADDMVHFLERFRNGFDPKKEQRAKAFNACVPYTDGRCGERIVNDMADSILREAQSAPKPKIAIFGLGGLFRYYWEDTDIFSHDRFDIIVFSDNDASRWGERFHGIPVVKPEGLRDFSFDKIVVFSERYFMEIFRQLVYDVRIDIDRIYRLDKFLFEIISEADN
ncbi:MAG: hypothetical protein LBK56_01505 [Gracilibacteraceae bacterium]|jgi:hypothetical protein|nr:hypothetical protein [Gracilibacteraceae bacterium]